MTFDTLQAARKFLSVKESEVLRQAWLPPTTVKAKPITFGAYADAWLVQRTLAPRTRELYRRLLDNHILPTFKGVPVGSVRPDEVRTWYSGLDTGPTAQSHAYSLLRTIYNTAVQDDLIAANPCRIRAAGQSKRVKEPEPATVAELQVITEGMPDRLKLMVTLGAWCGLRLGEIAELRRENVDLVRGEVRVRHAVSWTDDGPITKSPKSAAGVRNVPIPSGVIPLVKKHLREHCQLGAQGRLFYGLEDGGIISEQTVRSAFLRARKTAGRDDLRFHDLRGTGATMLAEEGATLPEIMAFLGHDTPNTSLRYMHKVQGRGRVLADKLSARMVAGE